MATPKKTAPSMEVEQTENTNLPMAQTEVLNTSEMLAKLSDVKNEDLKPVPDQIGLTIDEGDVYNLKYIGTELKQFDDSNEPKEVAIFEDENEQQYYNGNSFLVNGLKRLQVVPNFVRITGTEKKKSNAGTFYKTFEIRSVWG